MAFVEGVVAGDEARDHAGVGCFDVAPDQREPHAGHRLQAETSQDMDVGVTPANQHKVLEEGRRLHRDPYIRSASPLVRP